MKESMYRILATSAGIVFLIAGCFVAVGALPHLAAAQQLVPPLQNTLVLDVSPAYPGPNERATVSVESFSIDLNRAAISWFVNDSLRSAGDAQKEFSLTTGGLGSASTITVVVEMSDGTVLSEEVTIRPVSIELLWQADSYAPPLYRGKKLPAIGGGVRIVAMPRFVAENGVALSPQNLVYAWKENDNPLLEQSGKGRQEIALAKLVPGRTVVVDIEISSLDQTLYGTKRVTLSAHDPEIIVYEDNPLLGTLFHAAVENTFALSGTETRFVAYPYKISATTRTAPHLNYRWTLDRAPITLGDDPGSITVSHSGGEGGAAFSVSLENTRDILQRALKNFAITFGDEVSSGFGQQ